jgi:hypothetical protein
MMRLFLTYKRKGGRENCLPDRANKDKFSLLLNRMRVSFCKNDKKSKSGMIIKKTSYEKLGIQYDYKEYYVG